jgi:hypothetical protein
MARLSLSIPGIRFVIAAGGENEIGRIDRLIELLTCKPILKSSYQRSTIDDRHHPIAYGTLEVVVGGFGYP